MKFLLPLLLICLPLLSVAQETTVTFDKRVLKMEPAVEGSQLAFSFPFTNSGDHPLVITDYKVSCTCTVVAFPKEPIMPGKSDEIQVTFDSSGKTGWQYRKIQLTANSRKTPLEVEFRVKILPAE